MLTSFSLEGSFCSASRSQNSFVDPFDFPVFKNDDHRNGSRKNKKPEHDFRNIQLETKT